jgi:hypothetical protein
MDVHCSTCNEPWDVFYLRHEAVFNSAFTQAEAEDWCFLTIKERLTNKYREKFRTAGWQFGLTVVNVLRCPCCPDDAQANPALVLTKGAMEEMLADDEDALALIFADHAL